MRLIRVGWRRWSLVGLLGLLTLHPAGAAAAELFFLDSRSGVPKRFLSEPSCTPNQNLFGFSPTLGDWAACKGGALGNPLAPIASGAAPDLAAVLIQGRSANDVVGEQNFLKLGDSDLSSFIAFGVDASDGPTLITQCTGGPCDKRFVLGTGKEFAVGTDVLDGFILREAANGVIRLREQTGDPATPPASYRDLYAKSDGFYQKNSAGAVSQIGAGGGVTSKHFDAHQIVPDGTNCVAGIITPNASQPTDVITCADSNSSLLSGKLHISEIGGCPASTLNFTIETYHSATEGSTIFAGDFQAQYRRSGSTDVINSTYSAVDANSDADVTIGTAHELEVATAAITPNGTCDATAYLLWKYTVNATRFTAAATTNHVLGVTVAKP